ncbi:MAG: sensor histidine kinase [Lachnospiraceae bacterium]|nr:sensor histidine kinase [Lachnospiraceae bacterium]
MWKKGSTLKKRLNTLLLVCLIPLAALLLYLLIMVDRFSRRYDVVVEKITKANAYNIDFKEDMDYLMYIIVVNAERAGELVDTQKPHLLIEDARQVFQGLYETADEEYAKNRLNGILKSLNTLEDRIEEIEADALVSGSYDRNMERLDLNIRILTELIQEQIQKYIYYETTNLESLREGIRADVDQAIRTVGIGYVFILAGALLISRKIMTNITEPVRRLCEMTRQAGRGDFAVRAREGSDDELAVLNSSFNQMVEEVGNLVEDIRVEQLNLRATELKLLQAQINPHFLYNTLDTIIWLAEAGDSQQVVILVSALSDFFRTTLSKGRDYITVREEEAHIRSYLQIQQFRYRDILEYEIQIPEELYQYQILKLTLQPLVENALYHGIKNKRGMGKIRVTGEHKDGRLFFRVWDNGKGMNETELLRVRELIKGGKNGEDGPSGFGLFNVAQRICLNYGAEYGLFADSAEGEWTEFSVEIPAVKN